MYLRSSGFVLGSPDRHEGRECVHVDVYDLTKGYLAIISFRSSTRDAIREEPHDPLQSRGLAHCALLNP